MSALAARYLNQNSQFARAFQVLQQAIADRAFPGASFAVTNLGKLVALAGLGSFTYDSKSAQISAETVFDLASVTKVIATTTMAMILHERGKLDLDASITDVLPEFAGADARKSHVTFRMLLAHSSGLPAHVLLHKQAQNSHDILQAGLSVPLEAEPESRAVYSDIGFIVLGEALSRMAGEPLDKFCKREILQPLDMTHTRFNPLVECTSQIPPTIEDHGFRHRVIQGEVFDENCHALCGVAGHAGLFAPAEDVARFAHCMLSGGAPILRPETIELFTRRVSQPAVSSRTLGWDTPSVPSQSGKYFSPRSFGHLGYTGTSMWIDPERELSITLLTNRTWPDAKSQKIKEVRPAFHDAVVEALERV